MANFLPALIFAALAAADFSHPAHLALQLECTVCHVSVTASTRTEDNNLPPREVCLRCHQEAVIRQPTPTALAHFNHQLHIKIRQCTGCHRAPEVSLPRMADCVVCHNQFDIPDSCWRCHSRTMNLMPATHVTGFLDAHSRVKYAAAQKQSCDVCHGPAFRCAGCH